MDNTIASFCGQLENGVYVPSFFGDQNDKELPKIAEFLLGIADAADVRKEVTEFAGIVRLYEEYVKDKEAWETDATIAGTK